MPEEQETLLEGGKVVLAGGILAGEEGATLAGEERVALFVGVYGGDGELT